MKKICVSILVLFAASFIFAQSIQTASEYFQSISDYYANIQDYEANLVITTAAGKMQCKVSFKRPNLLRMDFSDPDTQVIAFNGELLTIYLPGSNAILLQNVATGDDAGTATGASLATPQGLTLMSRYYYIAYESGQSPVPLSEESDEMVVKFILTKKSASESFKTLKVAINPTMKLIRRIEAVTTANETFVFEFSGYNLNSNIPDARFIYDAPSSANNYNNFLFTE
ncbi:MAG: outer membrane lipoprotein carrier protein LolA [Treponema sp.]|nr:outer membrane lipoprotein carrier protein LolA [Candidatus Treponema caballi]